MSNSLRNCVPHAGLRAHMAVTLAAAFLFAAGSLFATAGFAATGNPEIKPPDKYAQSGKIRYCTTFTNPPREYFDNGKPAGADVDLAQAMADLMGLKVDWVQLKFASLITALQAGQCDMVVEELYIKPAREKVIDFVPFSVSAEQAVVRKGNPAGIHSLDDMSGKKVAVPNGTTFQQILQERNKELEAAGKPKVRILAVPGTKDMFNQVMAGTVDAGGATATSVAFYIRKTNGRLETAGEPFHKIKDGFGVRKSDTDLRKAMEQALHQLMQSGEYKKILARYSLQSAALD